MQTLQRHLSLWSLEGFKGKTWNLLQVKMTSFRADRVRLLTHLVNGKLICIILIVSASYLSGKEVNIFNLIGAEKQQLVFI